MVIIPEYFCKLGNQMFQYCWGRIIAEHFGYGFQAPALLNLPTDLPGKMYTDPVQVLCDLNEIPVDPESVFGITDPRRIELRGLFQQADKYAAHREKIKSWFAGSLTAQAVKEKTVGVHIRLGDYYTLGWHLPVVYYHRAIESILGFNPNRCIVYSDGDGGILKAYLDGLLKYFPKLTVHRGPPLETLESMMSCEFIVTGNSSFSWWAAFLSDANRVTFPYNWQPYGRSQTGDQLKPSGYLYPSDLRYYGEGWEIIDLRTNK